MLGNFGTRPQAPRCASDNRCTILGVHVHVSMGTIIRAFTLALACFALPAIPTRAAEPNSNPDGCNDNMGHYSVLRVPSSECADPPVVESKQRNPPQATHHDELVDVGGLGAEVLGFSTIGLAQIRGGTALLGDIWYAAAVLTPPLLQQHPSYGMKVNYLAITPPFVALGLLNGYLRHDHADNSRVFLSNFIGFNLSLAWARHVWSSPDHFFSVAETEHVPQLDTSVFALSDGAGVYFSYRW